MLTHRQRIATLLATLGAGLAILLVVLLGEKPVPTQPVVVLPGSSGDYWRISRTAYLPGRTARWVVFVGLVPVLLAGVFAGLNFALGRVLPAGHAPPGPRPRPSGWLLLRPLVYLIPGLLALVALYALSAADVLMRYEPSPATAKDVYLYQLPLVALAALVVTLLVGYWILRVVRNKLPAPGSFAATKQVLYLWLCVVALAAFLHNPYAMALYLGLFAYGARWLHPPRNTRSRVINAVVLVISAAPFAALLYSFAMEISRGWRILWHQVLQRAYGDWSPWAVVIFLLAAVLWVQFLSASVLRAPAKASGAPTRTRPP